MFLQMTINYMPGQKNNMLMERYGFSTSVVMFFSSTHSIWLLCKLSCLCNVLCLLQNPWDAIPFSGDSRIHLNSFLSVFNIFGLPEEYYHDSKFNFLSFPLLLEKVSNSVTYFVDTICGRRVIWR